MVKHGDLSGKQLFKLLRTQFITLAGNRKLKIYGRLNCNSGRRMKEENRVFFKNETEAKLLGFRPCGHCLRDRYNDWKKHATF